MLLFLVVCYLSFGIALYSQYKLVCKRFNVVSNSNKWVVRDNKGRFVKLPSKTFGGFFDLISLV